MMRHGPPGRICGAFAPQPRRADGHGGAITAWRECERVDDQRTRPQNSDASRAIIPFVSNARLV
jgi:hypothetical protein